MIRLARMRIDLGRRFVLAAGSGLAMLLLSTLALLLGNQAMEAARQEQTAIQAVTATLAAQLRAAVAFSDPKAAGAILASLADVSGARVAKVSAVGRPEFATFAREAPAIRGLHAQLAARLQALLQHRFTVSRPIVLDGDRIGSIEIEGEVGATAHLLATQLLILVPTVPIVALGCFGGTLWLQRRLWRPLQTLADTMQRVLREQASGARATHGRNDEIGRLLDVFNTMLDKIDDREQQLARVNLDLAETVKDLRYAKEEAESASRSKSQFLANMSHEVRTPMNGVLGMANLLIQTDLTDRQKRYATIIRGSGEGLMRVINDVLDVSKIEAGKLELLPIALDLRQTVEDVVELLAERAHGKGLEIVCAYPPQIPAAFKADPVRVRQILINLLGNAIKFTERGEVSVRVLAIDENPGDVLLRFEVRDTGAGIPADMEARIFEKFTQVEDAHNRQFGGTGLGLSIARQLAELMGGQIGVNSEPGQGSLFWFTARFERTAELADANAAPTALRGRRVLVIDDRATARDVIIAHCAAWDVDAQGVDSVNAAQHLLSNEKFDAVLLDTTLPGDLADAAARLRASGAPRLALLTTYDQAGMAAGQRVPGATLVQKPVRQAELLRSLCGMFELRTPDGLPVAAPERRKMPRFAGRVLLAEDNPVNQEIAATALSQLGCTVVAVASGPEALAAITQEAFDLVFMDCQMPGMDGFEVARRVREQERAGGPRVPIVALTAHALADTRAQCLAAGMDDYLPKPFAEAELVAALGLWLGTPAVSDAPPAAAESAAPVAADLSGLLDPAALERLRAINPEHGARLLQRVLQLYVSRTPELLGRIESGLRDGDLTAISDAAHSLKSSSAHIGAFHLSGLLAELETSLSNGLSPDAGRRYAEVSREFEMLRVAITHDFQAVAA